jgi:NADH dehydrogenase
MGVDVRLGTKVTDVDATGITVTEADGGSTRIEALTKVWAAGVQASPLGRQIAEQSGAGVDRAGRVQVLPDLTVPGHPEVFVVGDMMALDGLPGVAQVAIQGARFAAGQITRRLDGAPVEPRFEYVDKGSMATISRFSAVASIGRLRFSGFFAWVLWLAIHLVYIIGFKHRVTTLLHWAVSFLGRGRSERVATEQQVFGRHAIDVLPHGELPYIPTDPADGEVSGVAELEDRRRRTA